MSVSRLPGRLDPPGLAGVAVVLLAGVALPPTAAAQTARFDTASLGQGPHARSCMLLERTIFKVDVLTLDLRFGPGTAAELRERVARGASRDSIAATAMGSRNAFARIVFRRDVGMDRFLDGVRRDLRRAARAGIIDASTYEEVSAGLPRWYGFLEGRGVLEGDRLVYRIRGDTLHSGYRTPDGEWLLRQTDVGAQRRLAVLGSYLVEGSSFREGLLDGLTDGVENGC